MENFNEDADIRDELLTNVGQAIAKAFYEFGDRDKRVIQNAAISNAVQCIYRERRRQPRRLKKNKAAHHNGGFMSQERK